MKVAHYRRRGTGATIASSRGSVPTFQSAKMLLRDDGSPAAHDQSTIAHWGRLSGEASSALA